MTLPPKTKILTFKLDSFLGARSPPQIVLIRKVSLSSSAISVRNGLTCYSAELSWTRLQRYPQTCAVFVS